VTPFQSHLAFLEAEKSALQSPALSSYKSSVGMLILYGKNGGNGGSHAGKSRAKSLTVAFPKNLSRTRPRGSSRDDRGSVVERRGDLVAEKKPGELKANYGPCCDAHEME
jgi:hypothetical protein